MGFCISCGFLLYRVQQGQRSCRMQFICQSWWWSWIQRNTATSWVDLRGEKKNVIVLLKPKDLIFTLWLMSCLIPLESSQFKSVCILSSSRETACLGSAWTQRDSSCNSHKQLQVRGKKQKKMTHIPILYLFTHPGICSLPPRLSGTFRPRGK